MPWKHEDCAYWTEAKSREEKEEKVAKENMKLKKMLDFSIMKRFSFNVFSLGDGACILPCSSSSSSSLRVARGEVFIHRLIATLLAVVEAGAIKATTAGLNNHRGEGVGIRRSGRRGRQGRSRGGG